MTDKPSNYNQVSRTQNGVLVRNWFEDSVLRSEKAKTTFDRTMMSTPTKGASPFSKEYGKFANSGQKSHGPEKIFHKESAFKDLEKENQKWLGVVGSGVKQGAKVDAPVSVENSARKRKDKEVTSKVGKE